MSTTCDQSPSWHDTHKWRAWADSGVTEMPTGIYPRKLKSVEDRFWKKVEKTTGCWNWVGERSWRGYGRFFVGHRTYPAHWFPFLFRGEEIPDGLVCDHLCRNRGCVNPDHIQFVTNAENVLMGVGVTAQNARKTHCKRGHEFTPQNIYRVRSGGRNCGICKKLHNDNRTIRLRIARLAALTNE